MEKNAVLNFCTVPGVAAGAAGALFFILCNHC
jgi:hypothetical protein